MCPASLGIAQRCDVGYFPSSAGEIRVWGVMVVGTPKTMPWSDGEVLS
jgi:hypothetical protein